VPREALPDEYRRSDLFVLPTLADNTPVTLMEAMACGVPAVATSVGGVPELVEPGQSGLLVPAGDVAALTSALERLLADPDARRRMGAVGRQVAESRFARGRMVSDLEAAYGFDRGRTGEAVTLARPAALGGGHG
jgi:glycosyltransferase involved in cell wall biosynthesis